MGIGLVIVDVEFWLLFIMLYGVFLVEVGSVEVFFIGCIVSIFMRLFVVNFMVVIFDGGILLVGFIEWLLYFLL